MNAEVEYPIHIPKDSLLAEKIVQEAHIQTIHGGERLTMGNVRKKDWIQIHKTFHLNGTQQLLLMGA